MLGYGDAHAGAIVRAMERSRLIERRPNGGDRRRIDLYLTPEGRKKAQQARRLMRAINAHIVAGLSASEARSLHALLLRAHDNLKAPQAPSGQRPGRPDKS